MWDDKWKKLLKDVSNNGSSVTRKNSTRDIIEIISYKFEVDNPRDRLIFDKIRGLNIFQCIGQFLWITQGNFNLEAIKYYQPSSDKFSSDGVKMIGAYGPRLFGIQHLNQMSHVIDTLADDPGKRRAVASVYLPQFDQHGLANEEVPCTLNLQYVVRDDKLQAVTYMRSQDAFNVLPYDFFIFTMLQEYLLNELGREHPEFKLGRYNHYSGSFHVYQKDLYEIKQVIENESAEIITMKEMPSKDVKLRLRSLNKFESIVRTVTSSKVEYGLEFDFDSMLNMVNGLLKDEYWIQLGLILLSYSAIKTDNKENHRKVYGLLHQEYQHFVRLYIDKHGFTGFY